MQSLPQKTQVQLKQREWIYLFKSVIQDFNLLLVFVFFLRVLCRQRKANNFVCAILGWPGYFPCFLGDGSRDEDANSECEHEKKGT